MLKRILKVVVLSLFFYIVFLLIVNIYIGYWKEMNKPLPPNNDLKYFQRNF